MPGRALTATMPMASTVFAGSFPILTSHVHVMGASEIRSQIPRSSLTNRGPTCRRGCGDDANIVW